MFRDRTAAGRALAERLASVVARPAVVAGIPRGGVVVALPIAERLGAPLTVVYARKLTAPFDPELAFGALDEDGESLLDPGIVAALGLGPEDVEAAKRRVQGEIRRRIALYKAPPLAAYLPDSAVVLVDDGLATGLTMRAALAYARRHAAREITVAVPCSSVQAAAYFRREADRFVSLVVDEGFLAVGQYYEDFSPVSDDAVCATLARAPATPPAPPDSLRIAFKNSLGLRLVGDLLLPGTRGPHPVVVAAHGWGSSKASPRNRAVAEALCAAGVAAFLFDFTGHGDSEGDRADATGVQQADDLEAALDTLRSVDDLDLARVGLLGASSGAAAVLRVAAARAPALRALVLRSANVEGAEEVAPRVTVPTLLIVGEHDHDIRRTNEALAARLGGPHRLAVVPGGDHLFSDPGALREATALAVAWLTQHL